MGKLDELLSFLLNEIYFLLFDFIFFFCLCLFGNRFSQGVRSLIALRHPMAKSRILPGQAWLSKSVLRCVLCCGDFWLKMKPPRRWHILCNK